MGSAFDQTVEPGQQQASQVAAKSFQGNSDANELNGKKVSAFAQTIEPSKPKEQFDLGATYNQYVKPTLDAAGAEFKQHGLIPELFDAGRGAAEGVAELGDIAGALPKYAADRASNALGWHNHMPTAATSIRNWGGKPQGQIAHDVGHFLPSVALQFNPQSRIANALAGGAINTALGEGNKFAQTGKFDPMEAAKQFGVGIGVSAVTGATAAIAQNAARKAFLRNAFKEARAGRALPDFKAQVVAAREARNAEAMANAQAQLKQAASQAKPRVRQQPGIKTSEPEPPKEPPSNSGITTEQSPSTREQVIGMKGGRPATPEETEAFKPSILAKIRRDKAQNDLEQAFHSFIADFKKRGLNPEDALSHRPDFIHPEIGRQIREAARIAAGIKDQLEKVSKDHLSSIRDENLSRPFDNYKVKGVNDIQKAVELKKLSNKVESLQRQYDAIKKDAGAHAALQPRESVHLDINGHRYVVSHHIQNEYHMPQGTTAEQAAAYKLQKEALEAAERAKSNKNDLVPSFEKFAAAIKGIDTDVARLMSGGTIKDKDVLALAEKTGMLKEMKGFLFQMMEEETGSGQTGYGFKVATIPLQVVWKAAQAANIKTPKQFITRINQVFLNEMNMDIFKRDAEPYFVAKLQQAIGKRALALQGVDLHHMSVDALNDWVKLSNDADIMASPHLSPELKTAKIAVNAVQKEGAAMLKRYIQLEKSLPTQNKGLIAVLEKELLLNWEKPHSPDSALTDFMNAITTGTTSSISLGNTHMHILHAVEAVHANTVYAPGEFARGLHAITTDPKGTWAFANSWNTKLPMTNMSDDSLNKIGNFANKLQEPLIKAIKSNPVTHAAQQAISGQGIESIKGNLTLITASEYAAKEMKYAGGGAALRNDMMAALKGGGTMSPDKRLEAATLIWDHMDRALGAGPAGYKVANTIDRATAGGGSGGAFVRMFAPFTRSIIQQSRLQTGIVKGLGHALASGDLPGIKTGTRQLLTSAAIMTSVAGANVIPHEVRIALASGSDKDKEALKKIDAQLEKCAVVGHYLGGWTMSHVETRLFPLASVSGNAMMQLVKDIKTLTGKKATTKARFYAASMLLAKLNLNNIADTISLETVRKMYEAYKEAQEHGTNTHYTFSEPGLNVPILGGQRLPAPFGTNLVLGHDGESKMLHKTVEHMSPAEAVTRKFFQPGESEQADHDRRTAMMEYNAKMARKSRR